MKNSRLVNKHCTNCGEYNERVDDPELKNCPFCYSTLIKNYITQKAYILDGGWSDMRIPAKLTENYNKKLKNIWNPTLKVYEDYDRFI